MENEFPGYEKGIKELESILQKLDSGEISIDEITELVKRASFLLEKCRNKLRDIEDELENTFEAE